MTADAILTVHALVTFLAIAAFVGLWSGTMMWIADHADPLAGDDCEDAPPSSRESPSDAPSPLDGFLVVQDHAVAREAYMAAERRRSG